MLTESGAWVHDLGTIAESGFLPSNRCLNVAAGYATRTATYWEQATILGVGPFGISLSVFARRMLPSLILKSRFRRHFSDDGVDD